MKELLKQNKGVTLLALVVTIIIIFVLAGITISALVGDHGIIEETKQAKEDYLAGEAADQSTLDSALAEIRRAREEAGLPPTGNGSYSGGNSSSSGTGGNSGSGNSSGNNSGSGNGYNTGTGTGTNGTGPTGTTGGSTDGNYNSSRTPAEPVTFAQAISNDMFSKTTNSAYTDSTIMNNNVVTIPAGYRMTTDASTINEGIVIEDSNENQWVWIPVDNPSEMYELLNTPLELGGTGNSGILTSYRSKTILSGQERTTIGATEGYREPDIVITYDKQANASTLLATAGFTAVPATATTPSKTAFRAFAEDISYRYYEMIESVKAYGGFYIFRNLVSVGYYENWYKAYGNCSAYTTDSAVSRMVWGCCWDEVCKFISEKGSGTTEPYTNVNSSSHNINRLSGNGSYNYGSYFATQECYGTQYRTGRQQPNGGRDMSNKYDLDSTQQYCSYYYTKPVLYVR